MKKIYAIVKHPGEKVGHIMEIENELKPLQELVGGYIETVTPPDAGFTIICNEDGMFLELPYNCTVKGVDFVGTIAVVGVVGDNFGDCPLDLKQWENDWLKG